MPRDCPSAFRLRVVDGEVVPYRIIHLTQGQSTIVDAEDYERLSQHKWFAQWDKDSNGFYAGRNIRIDGKRGSVSMHREIKGSTKGTVVDHQNRQTLDNRKENLRAATGIQNSQNRKCRFDNKTGLKGVTFCPNDLGRKRYRATIQVNGKRSTIGHSLTAEEAYAAYCEAAKRYFGEFARLE